MHKNFVKKNFKTAFAFMIKLILFIPQLKQTYILKIYALKQFLVINLEEEHRLGLQKKTLNSGKA